MYAVLINRLDFILFFIIFSDAFGTAHIKNMIAKGTMLNDAKPCQGCPVLGFCAASCSGSPKVQSSWDEQMTEAIIMLQI